MRRFAPANVAMNQAFASGVIGPALMMHNLHGNVSAPPNSTGQMAITNSAPHELDIARFVLEAEYDSINVFRPDFSDTPRWARPSSWC